ncbi:hypothetical protein U8Q05_26860 (plasmid) [Rhizobium ruizarguesonis]|nr:hypothetical protein U8Q05_26860 [Rhizobium ruizarguesonis]
MKVDILALGMLTCMAKAFDLIREHKERDLDLSKIEQEDPATLLLPISEGDVNGHSETIRLIWNPNVVDGLDRI